MEESINIIIPNTCNTDNFIKKVVAADLHTPNLFGSLVIKIGVNHRTIDLLDLEVLFYVFNEYLRESANQLTRFKGNEKFDVIILEASDVHEYGIEEFKLDFISENLLKHGGEIIIIKCHMCTRCNKLIEDTYPDIAVTWKNEFNVNAFFGDIHKKIEIK
jgi:hypothetical protein